MVFGAAIQRCLALLEDRCESRRVALGADELRGRCESTFAVHWPTTRFVWTETMMREGSGRYPATSIAGRARVRHGGVSATVVPLLNTRDTPQASRWYDTVRPVLHLSTSAAADGEMEVSIRVAPRRYLHAWIIGAFAVVALGAGVLVVSALLRVTAGVVGGVVMSLSGSAVIAMVAWVAPEAELGYRALSAWLDEVLGPRSTG